MTLIGPHDFDRSSDFIRAGYSWPQKKVNYSEGEYDKLALLNSRLARDLPWHFERGHRRDRQSDAFGAELKKSLAEILAFEDDWDGEGSPAFAREPVERAEAVVRLHRAQLLESGQVSIPIPAVGPGPDGSVDLLWKNQFGTLLVNIPASADQAATYSGSDYRGDRIKGSFDASRFNHGVAGCLLTLAGR